MVPHAHEARNVDGRLPSSITIGHEGSAAEARLFRTFPRTRYDKQDENPVRESQELKSLPWMPDWQPTMRMPVARNSQQAFRARSKTWSSSSENLGLEGDQDMIDDRKIYIDEYNRLSRKVNNVKRCGVSGWSTKTRATLIYYPLQYGIRPLVPSDFPATNVSETSKFEK